MPVQNHNNIFFWIIVFFVCWENAWRQINQKFIQLKEKSILNLDKTNLIFNKNIIFSLENVISIFFENHSTTKKQSFNSFALNMGIGNA